MKLLHSSGLASRISELATMIVAGGFTCLCLLGTSCKDQRDKADGVEERKTARSPQSHEPARQKRNVKGALEGILRQAENKTGLIEALRTECGEIEQDDLDEVFEFLATDPPEGQSLSMWYLAANEVMEALGTSGLQDVAPRLFALATSEGVADVIHDYSVQHYIVACKTSLEHLPASDQNERSEVIERLMGNVKVILAEDGSPGSSIFGTTLMGLAAVADNLKGEELETVRLRTAPFVMPVIEGSVSHGGPARVSAIQTAARLGLPEAGPPIAAIAWDDGAEFSERVSAIAALRHYPDLADIGRLEELVKTNKTLRYASASTLDHLRKLQTSSNETR